MLKIIFAMALFNYSCCFAQKSIINKTFIAYTTHAISDCSYDSSNPSSTLSYTTDSYKGLKFLSNKKVRIISYSIKSGDCFSAYETNKSDTTYSFYRLNGNTLTIKDTEFLYSPLKLKNNKLVFKNICCGTIYFINKKSAIQNSSFALLFGRWKL